MAKRILKPQHQEEIRQKIRGSQLLNLVQSYALSGKYRNQSVEGKRIEAALGLLRKLVPDLSSQELTDKRGDWLDVMKRVAELEKAEKSAVQPQQSAAAIAHQDGEAIVSKTNESLDSRNLH